MVKGQNIWLKVKKIGGKVKLFNKGQKKSKIFKNLSKQEY